MFMSDGAQAPLSATIDREKKGTPGGETDAPSGSSGPSDAVMHALPGLGVDRRGQGNRQQHRSQHIPLPSLEGENDGENIIATLYSTDLELRDEEQHEDPQASPPMQRRRGQPGNADQQQREYSGPAPRCRPWGRPRPRGTENPPARGPGNAGASSFSTGRQRPGC